MAHSPAFGTSAASFPLSDRIESAAETIAVVGCSVLDEISAFCTLALNAMEHPSELFESEDLALVLQTIQARAMAQRDYMLNEAEAIGINASTPRALARSQARRGRFNPIRAAQQTQEATA